MPLMPVVALVAMLFTALPAQQTTAAQSQTERDWQRAYETAAKQSLDGKTTDAITTVQAFLSRHGDHADATYLQAKLYQESAGGGPTYTAVQKRALENAARLYLRAADLLKDSDGKFLCLWKLTAIYGPEELNQPREVERIARRMVAEHGTRPESHMVLANLLHERGDIAGAADALRIGRTRATDIPSIMHLQLVQFLIEQVQGDRSLPRDTARRLLDEANGVADEIVVVSKTEPQDYRLATMAKAMGLELMAERVETDRQKRLALMVESERYSAPIEKHVNGKPPAPERLTPAKAEALEWQYIDRWNSRLLDDGKYAEAIAAYQQYLTANPTLAEGQTRLGEVYIRWADQAKDAKDTATRNARLNQALVPLQKVIGLSATQGARETAFLKVIEVLQPDMLNQPSQIEAASRTMVQRYPMDVAPRATLALALFQSGRTAEANEVLRAARTSLTKVQDRFSLARSLVNYLRSDEMTDATAAAPILTAADLMIADIEKTNRNSAETLEIRAGWLHAKAEKFEKDPAKAKALNDQSKQLLERALAIRRGR